MTLFTPMTWLSAGIALSFLLFASCKQDTPKAKDESQEATTPVVAEGTTVTIEPNKENTINHSGYQISLPKGAVEEKTDIQVSTSSEQDFEDPAYKALGDGIALSGNVSSLLDKGCEISFDNPNVPDGTEMYVALVYNTDEPGLRATGDKAKHRVRILTKIAKQGARTALTLAVSPITDIVAKRYVIRPLEIIGASKLNQMVVKYQMPNMAELGLKEVVFAGGKGKITLKEPSQITAQDKVLLFIHGWTSSPIACWSTFITKLEPLVKEAGYTKYLTMGYNTSRPINENGKLLSLYLQNKLNGAKVDIVAHSMGGLVARSALENFGKDDLVQNLITLGTPHKGSPVAIIKYGLEAFSSVLLEENGKLNEYGRFVLKMYNDGSQGFQDLYTESDFIKGLANNEAPSTYYHTVAAIYSKGYLVGVGWLSRGVQDLLARADGVVTQESAWGIPKSENNGKGVVFMLPGKIPHVTLTESEEVIHHVSTVLKARAKVKLETRLPQGVIIENGVLKTWPNTSIPESGHVTIPSEVTVIGDNAFNSCSRLKSITFPSKLKAIGDNAFSACTQLQEVTLPNSVTDIGPAAFYGCINLHTVTLPNKLQILKQFVFKFCQTLKAIHTKNVHTIEWDAFSGCTRLAKVEVTDALKNIDREAFEDCRSLTQVTLPNSVTAVGPHCFSGCLKLTAVQLSESLTYIPWCLFKDCRSLIQITLPERINEVHPNAFVNCIALKSIKSKALYRPTVVDEYGNASKLIYTGKLIVPVGSKDSYAKSTGWGHCNPIVEED